MKIFLQLSFFLILQSCNQGDGANPARVSPVDTPPVSTIQSPPAVLPKPATATQEPDLSKAPDLRHAANIRILSISRKIDSIRVKDSPECYNWKLSRQTLAQVLKEFTAVPSEAVHLIFSYWPCEYTGELLIDGRECRYWVSAGATMVLLSGGVEYSYACTSPGCSGVFLSGEQKAE